MMTINSDIDDDDDDDDDDDMSVNSFLVTGGRLDWPPIVMVISMLTMSGI
jgi:hypothetical protein